MDLQANAVKAVETKIHEAEKSNSPVRRSTDLSTELKVDSLKRDLRMQRSATDEANLAIQRLQNHYESQLRNCENQIVE